MKKIEIEKAMANVKATLAVENLRASKKSKEITKKYLAGSLTSSQAIERIKNLHGC